MMMMTIVSQNDVNDDTMIMTSNDSDDNDDHDNDDDDNDDKKDD